MKAISTDALLFGLIQSAASVLYLNTAGLWWDAGHFFFYQNANFKFGAIVSLTTFVCMTLLGQQEYTKQERQRKDYRLQRCVFIAATGLLATLSLLAFFMLILAGAHAAAEMYPDIAAVLTVTLIGLCGAAVLVLPPALPYGALGGLLFWTIRKMIKRGRAHNA